MQQQGATHGMSEPNLERYARQIRFPGFGEASQQRLSAGSVLICGCGALGSVSANTLARAGVGHLRIVDRDFLEWNNLQRQVLYDESDVAAGLPKAIAAAEKLRRINSQIQIEPLVCDVDFHNIESLLQGIDIIVDGTDNFETRFLLNDASHQFAVPWVYGGCLGAEGQQLTIIPHQTPCLRCLIPEMPPPGTTPTCDTAGIFGPIINIIASLQAMEAIKLLSGHADRVSRTLSVVDIWDNRLRQISLAGLREQATCPTCYGRDYAWLRGQEGSHSAVLCGRNAVQLSVRAANRRLDLAELARKFAGLGSVQANDFLVRLTTSDHVLTVFPDGRAIIGGTEDIAEAKTLYAKYVGN